MRVKAEVIQQEEPRRSGKANHLYMRLSCLDQAQPALKNTFDFSLMNEEADKHKGNIVGKIIEIDVTDIQSSFGGRFEFRGVLINKGSKA